MSNTNIPPENNRGHNNIGGRPLPPAPPQQASSSGSQLEKSMTSLSGNEKEVLVNLLSEILNKSRALDEPVSGSTF